MRSYGMFESNTILSDRIRFDSIDLIALKEVSVLPRLTLTQSRRAGEERMRAQVKLEQSARWIYKLLC